MNLAPSNYTLADLHGDPVLDLFSATVTLRIHQGKEDKVRTIVMTPENSEWCVKHYGKYKVALGGMYPFMHGTSVTEDGIGMPTIDMHLSIAVELIKPEPEPPLDRNGNPIAGEEGGVGNA